MLLAEQRAAVVEAGDQMRHELRVYVSNPDDQVEAARWQRLLGILVEIGAQPLDRELALGGGAPAALQSLPRKCRARSTRKPCAARNNALRPAPHATSSARPRGSYEATTRRAARSGCVRSSYAPSR